MTGFFGMNFRYFGLLDYPNALYVFGAVCITIRITSYNVCYTKLLRVSGHLDLHARFEEQAAALLGTETALLFGSGFLTNRITSYNVCYTKLLRAVHDAADARVAIPIRAETRSLNLAMSAAVAVGEALRQTGGYPAFQAK